MQVTVRADFRGIEGRFRILDKQVPYAIADAINKTLIGAQNAQRRYMERKFVIRRRGLLKASVRMLKFANRSTLTGQMGINRNLPFWNIHEKGGNERPTRSRYIAVPMEVKRTKSGRISKARRPRNLKNSFVAKSTGGKNIIFQRKGKGKRETVTPMYSLNKQVRIRPRLNFERNVTKAINGLWEREASKAIQRQIDFARLR